MDLSEYSNIESLEDNHWWYIATHRAVLRELSKLRSGSKVLDAGCGTGGLASRLYGKFATMGFDGVSAAVRIASKKHGLTNCLMQGLIEEIPVKSGKFDAVTCIDVIYHADVVDECRALREMHRVLKPGGYLILQVPAFECLRGGHDEAVHTRKRYRAKEVHFILGESGFKIVKIFYRFAWLFLPALVIRRFSKGSGRSDLRPIHPVLNSLLAWISLYPDSRIFSRLPFGTSLFAIGERM
jgi:2-polyprenyl-3-methyl-5-hydroxy-6-metoxy-1,4-benzoquinol methylase